MSDEVRAPAGASRPASQESLDAPFLAAVVDTILPGDDGSPPLPTGTAAGVTERLAAQLAAESEAREPLAVLDAIARRAGGETAFARSDAAARTAAVQAVEEEMRDAFGRLVSYVLEEYYDADRVILAMGWRLEPPQPRGHVLPPFDETLLDPVRRRGKLWRDAQPRDARS